MAKRKSNGGRPRQDGARYNCGKLRPVGPTAQAVARRAEFIARHWIGDAPYVCRVEQEGMGTILGVWERCGVITPAQRGAGEWYAALQRSYRVAIDAPRLKLSSVEGSQGSITIPAEEAEEKDRRTMERFREAELRLSCCGWRVVCHTLDAIDNQGRPDPLLVRTGLDALGQ